MLRDDGADRGVQRGREGRGDGRRDGVSHVRGDVGGERRRGGRERLGRRGGRGRARGEADVGREGGQGDRALRGGGRGLQVRLLPDGVVVRRGGRGLVRLAADVAGARAEVCGATAACHCGAVGVGREGAVGVYEVEVCEVGATRRIGVKRERGLEGEMDGK